MSEDQQEQKKPINEPINETRAEKNRKRKNRNRKLLIGASAVLVLLLILGGWFYYYLKNPLGVLQDKSTSENGESEDNNEERWPGSSEFDKNIINIAILGFDRNLKRDAGGGGIFRPDTIMIASINFNNDEVCLLSIPRDTYVELDNRPGQFTKINHAYAYGHRDGDDPEEAHEKGMENQINTIRTFLGGVPVHYYVGVDMDGAAEIIDHVGGIEHDVEMPIYFDFAGGVRRKVLDSGVQRLSGDDALYYLRYRETGGDFGRVERQQKFLQEAFNQMLSQLSISNVRDIYNTLVEHVETDLREDHVMALALFAFEEMDTSEMNTFVFHGDGKTLPYHGQNISFVITDEEKRVEIIEEAFGGFRVQKRDITLPEHREASGQQADESSESSGESEDTRSEEEKRSQLVQEAESVINSLPSDTTTEDESFVREARNLVAEALEAGADEGDIDNLSRLHEAEAKLEELKESNGEDGDEEDSPDDEDEADETDDDSGEAEEDTDDENDDE